FYAWVETDRVESVTIRGQRIDGKLKTEQEVAGRRTAVFYTTRPSDDEALLPLLREKNVDINVRTEEQPFALQLMLSLLPWVLIIGIWIWLSRRAQKMMTGGGGALGGIIKNKSRKFEKATAVGVTFGDVAGLKSAKRDLQEVVQFLKEPE